MLITRRALIISAAASGLILPARSLAQPMSTAEAQAPLKPGDVNYKHNLYHEWYVKVFHGHCSCGIGECRVTDWRETDLGSTRGYDVIVNREWRPLPDDVYIPDEIPVALRRERAHICAYMDEGSTVIPCAIINSLQI